MARCRDLLIAGLMLGGAMVMSGPADAAAAARGILATSPSGVVPAQYYYQPERRYVPTQPRRRRVCWTERSRIFVGRDNWGRPLYRTVPRRVCRWRYY